MTWVASSPAARRAQFGKFLLGTGNMGGVALTTGPGIGLSDDDSLALIDQAISEGVTILDTADIYADGNSERIVGVWNKQHSDTDLLIQSKTGVTHNGPDLSAHRVARQLDHSIETIGRVDLYIAHAVDPRTPWAESLPVFSSAVRDGRIRAYGLSNVTEAALTAALETADSLDLVRPEIIQNAYSLLAREDEAAVLPIAKSEGLAYTPFSPLAYGILAGRYSRGERPTAGSSRASTGPRALGFLDNAELMNRVQQFDQIAAARGVSPAGLALAWLMNRPLVTASIIGISRPSQWQGVHEAIKLAWSDDIAGELDDLFPTR